ncbi:unnamed protein product, partial [Rotaria sp. Silwood1]
MSNQNSYDPYEELPSPKIELLHEMLSLPNIFDYRTTSTPTGIDQSCRSSLDSLSKSLTFFEQFSLENFEYGLDIYQCQRAPSPDIFGTTLPSTNLRLQDKKLLILAEPKAFYRDRYYCETDKTKNRAQRFIRAEDNQLKYEYPTV